MPGESDNVFFSHLTFVKIVAIVLCTFILDSFDTKISAADNHKIVEVTRVLVRLIDNVEVPALETGVLTKINVMEGEIVKKGQKIGTIYDDSVKLDLDKAKLQLLISKQKAKDNLIGKLAENAYENEKQLQKEHKHEMKITSLEAENVLKIQSIDKGKKVALNNYERAIKARKQFAGSISESEIEKRKLTLDKVSIDYDQALFENKINKIKVTLKIEESIRRALSVERFATELENANLQHEVQLLETELQKIEVNEVNLKLKRLNIEAPVDGVVVNVHRQQGEWVKTGEPLFRLINIKKMRAEGFVSIDKIPRDLLNANVTIQIDRSNSQTIKRKGKIVFISPEVDPDTREVLIWANFENPDSAVLPGMSGSMKIHLN